MKIEDLRAMPPGHVIEAGLCLVGSGPAGLTIAAELAGRGIDTVIFESGPPQAEDSFTTALNDITSVGTPRVMDQRKLRNRVFGGTSLTWSGRCAAFDDIDYAERRWVPHSGWPITAETMRPYIDRAIPHLGLTGSAFDGPSPAIALDGGALRRVMWRFSRDPGRRHDHMRFGRRAAAMQADNVRAFTYATVTQLVMSQDGRRVEGLEVKAPDGQVRHVRAGVVALCCGAIENARLLLASNRRDPGGIGNRHDLVGRFLMDHPRTVIGQFPGGFAEQVQARLGLFTLEDGGRALYGFGLSADVQRDEELLNCAAWTTAHYDERDPWVAARKFLTANDLRGRWREGRIVLGQPGRVLHGVIGTLRDRGTPRDRLPRLYRKIELDCLVEQRPDPDSRMTLAPVRDALGVPLPQIDWRISDQERRTVLRLGRAIRDAMRTANLPPLELAEWIEACDLGAASFYDPAHPSGTTRMADDPRAGVVDTEGRVHGIDNLYVGGSSVFPTAGHANPTLMIVALAIRLAETLAKVAKT